MHYGKDGAAYNCEILEVVDDAVKITVPVNSAHVLVHDAETSKFICKIV
jgi:hypothetical protein